jgi:hypothetical protein
VGGWAGAGKYLRGVLARTNDEISKAVDATVFAPDLSLGLAYLQTIIRMVVPPRRRAIDRRTCLTFSSHCFGSYEPSKLRKRGSEYGSRIGREK